ncbi:MAG TPA: hypothetical protein DD634_00695 [Lachnospiraceae bacterium]|jgi:hypothetical protein|nr:hypothetical protein [Lachnospiraceae bacterium]HBW55582.1 hypothetical protein [Lachnospiraceae bacterium]
MQINVALENNSDEQAEIIRKKWYKTTTAQQTRDAFIFNECVDRFSGEPEDLIPYIGKDEGSTIVQRRLTIKSESNDRLKTIAAAINKPLASTYRAIIAYTIDNLPTTEDNENMAEPVGVSQLLMEKIALLEKQMEACNQTLKEIKELTK